MQNRETQQINEFELIDDHGNAGKARGADYAE
jgi:hypothetical protein